MARDDDTGRDSEPTYAQRVRRELRVRCAELQTKKSWYPLPTAGDDERWEDTAIWWCGVTCEALGPDGSTAGHRWCHDPARSCYVDPASDGPT